MNPFGLVALSVLVAISVGCKNPYTDFYQSRQQVIGNDRFVQPQGDPAIYGYSGNLDKDNRAMKENGFDLVGYSSFSGGGAGATKENLLAQARTVGASVVMVKSQYAGSFTSAMPYTTTSPGQVITTNSYGTANAYGTGGSAYGSYQGSSSTYVPGTTTTQIIPYTVQRYDYLATYWAKIRNVRFGAFYLNLTPELSRQFQRNTGVVIDLLMKGTPAFYANVLVGDVIIKADDESVTDVQSFTRFLARNPGKRVTLTILRGSEQKTITVDLNS
ncbi:MAG TPA: PDZ domain-containing protein [Geothrix sp.]|jgi:hypothetical protein